MDFISFQKKLVFFDLQVFSLNDAVKIMDSSRQIVKSILSRWAREKKIFRLKKGFYSLNKLSSKFLFQKLFKDSYVGLYSALEFYGSSKQRFNNLDLISKRIIKDYCVDSTNINFHFVNKKLFFGFTKEYINNTCFFVSSREKTIIDCVYFSSKVYLSEIFDFIVVEKDNIDVKLLVSYLNKIDSSVLNKRVGYLFSLIGIELDLKFNKKVDKLNKNLGNDGELDKKRFLIINEVIENG